MGDHILAKNFGAAAGWMDQRQEQADGGGFPGAVRPDETEDLTFFLVERDIHDAAGFAVILGQIVDFDDAHRIAPLHGIMLNWSSMPNIF